MPSIALANHENTESSLLVKFVASAIQKEINELGKNQILM